MVRCQSCIVRRNGARIYTCGEMTRLIIALSLVIAIAYAMPVEKLSKSTDYDHYVFAQEYPAGMCYAYFEKGKGYECSYSSNTSTWTIHGLWPTKGSTKGPNFCNNVDFDADSIQSLLPQLTTKWTNLLNETAFYDFWSHEYSKHGTCSGMAELEFFSTVLGIFDRLPKLGDVFEGAGITPNSNEGYQVDDVISAIKDKFGAMPVLQCCDVSENQIIQQIQICLDLQYQPIECPNTTSSCKDDSVLYPQYKP